MRIVVISVARRAPPWLADALEEYTVRFPRELRLSMTVIAPARRGRDEPVEKVMAAETRKIRDAIPAGTRVIALDEGGKQFDTRTLAGRLRKWIDGGEDVAFVIGGADGLHREFLRGANERWSLGALTLPHGVARLVLVEQLYRAWSILNNHPYHRE